ncbi:disks large homolog 1-like isoform X2 [Apteryx mantelli]|uniref:Disks large homolog 1-like isoform X2 n=1 Tax=Apteryx mantelli TaxID=2696672 RepID=A0ABM4F564_9AVES
MIRREDTERAVEILTRYQSTLRSPEEQELKASIGKVSHIFQSELFQALLDIHEFYDLTLRSAPASLAEPTPAPSTSPSTGRQQVGAGAPGPPAEPPGPPEGAERRPPAGARPRLVRVTARRTEAPASVRGLLVGARGALPQAQR